ncbi:MAG: Hint domain-containing protein [Dehalococcoidia bacterium]
MVKSVLFLGIALMSMLTLFCSACAQQPVPAPTPTVTYSLPELKYILFSNFSNVFFVDPDFYPLARVGQEEKNALEQFPVISADGAEFPAILKHLGLQQKPEYSDAEKLLIYREHKKLTLAVQITPTGDNYQFVLRVGENQGERITGTITPSGIITVTKREPVFNTYPICLVKGTLIDTPGGPVSVEQIRKGMSVWTQDISERRLPADVVEITSIEVAFPFRVVKISLSDGRTVSASPSHPSAEGRALGGYRTGDALDGAVVVGVEFVPYDGASTYDFLPDGPTGLYWANGILLRSTLAAK